MTRTDRYGMPLTTSSSAAAEQLQLDMDRLLAPLGTGPRRGFALTTLSK
jgi:hypothetical protein